MVTGNNEYWVTTTTSAENTSGPPNWTLLKDYKVIFEKLITNLLGSSKVPQEVKDNFVNMAMKLEEFRLFVTEYFPEYTDKIKVWEILHNEKKSDLAK